MSELESLLHDPRYDVRPDGTVWKLYLGSGRPWVKNPHWKQTGLSPNSNGYYVLGYGGRKGKTIYVHHVVFRKFHGPIPEGMEVDHVNRDKQDNRPENLRLATRGMNHANCDRYEKGPGGVVLTDEQRDEIQEETRKGASISALARRFSVSRDTISKVARATTRRVA